MLDKTEYINELLDFYEELLTEKQRNILYDYYKEDLSLNEIAELQGTSKAAVYDLIKRTVKIMENYENKIHLVSNYQKRITIYQKIQQIGNVKINEYIKECIEIE